MKKLEEEKLSTRKKHSCGLREFEEKTLHSNNLFMSVLSSDARSALPMVVAPKCMFDYL